MVDAVSRSVLGLALVLCVLSTFCVRAVAVVGRVAVLIVLIVRRMFLFHTIIPPVRSFPLYECSTTWVKKPVPQGEVGGHHLARARTATCAVRAQVVCDALGQKPASRLKPVADLFELGHGDLARCQSSPGDL
jgi:hypothetical protein